IVSLAWLGTSTRMVRGPTLRAGTGRMPRSNQRRAVLGWMPLRRAHSLSFTPSEYQIVHSFATPSLLTPKHYGSSCHVNITWSFCSLAPADLYVLMATELSASVRTHIP